MQTEIFKVTGMTCGGCVNSVKKTLNAISGVSDVEVDLPTGSTKVLYDDLLATSEQLKTAIIDAGYGIDQSGNPQAAKSSGGCCCG